MQLLANNLYVGFRGILNYQNLKGLVISVLLKFDNMKKFTVPYFIVSP